MNSDPASDLRFEHQKALRVLVTEEQGGDGVEVIDDGELPRLLASIRTILTK